MVWRPRSWWRPQNLKLNIARAYTWETSKLILIGSAVKQTKYIPICLINILRKVYGNLINRQLMEEVYNKGGLHQKQYGFRKKCSTLNVIRGRGEVCQKIYRRRKSKVVWSDLNKHPKRLQYGSMGHHGRETRAQGYLHISGKHLQVSEEKRSDGNRIHRRPLAGRALLPLDHRAAYFSSLTNLLLCRHYKKLFYKKKDPDWQK